MNTLEETTSDNITTAYVRRRVKDWKDRLEALYAQLVKWLPPEWEARRGKYLPMQETMMKAHRVPAVRLKSLELRNADGQRILVMPNCLWIVGWNGRIDLIGPEAHYKIVDASEIWEKPRWRMYSVYNRPKVEILNSRSFRAFLKHAAHRQHSRRV